MGARGRKSQYVKVVTNKDAEMLSGLARVGYMDRSMLVNAMGLSENRLKNYERDGYLERCAHMDKKTGDERAVWTLTQRGRTLCESQLGIDSYYKSSSAGHDLTLAQKYMDLEPEDRERWVTESEWREMYYDKFGVDLPESLSPPDGGYITSTGELIAYEVVTPSYRGVDIAAKMEYCESMGASYVQERW